jgi:hypothetical protein
MNGLAIRRGSDVGGQRSVIMNKQKKELSHYGNFDYI